MKKSTVPPPLSFACPQKWESMRADGPGRRFCEQCQLHVHDLSSLPATEAGSFVASLNGRICVSYQVAPDGSMVTHTRWGALQSGWKFVRRGVIALLAMAAPAWLTACAGSKTDCYRTGGVYVANLDGKDSPPKHAGSLDDTRLTGRTSHP